MSFPSILSFPCSRVCSAHGGAVTVSFAPHLLALQCCENPSMPLYALFCLTRPQAGKEALTQIIRTAGQAVLARGGVLTDVTSFGEQQLAYEIRKPAGKFDQVRVGRYGKAAANCTKLVQRLHTQLE
jgi:ribosomal protein S6